MATHSNTSYYQTNTLSSGLHRHAMSFQSGTFNSTPDIIPTDSYYGVNSYYGLNSSPENLMFFDSSSIISSGSPTTSAAGNCSSDSLLLNSVPGLKHDAGLTVDWSEEEQCMLEKGLIKYKDEHRVMQYIKIAAGMQNKSVRDVALRCHWMMVTRTGGRYEGSNFGRKGNYRKDKFVASCSNANSLSASVPNVAPYSFQRNPMEHNQRVKCQALSSETRQLLEQNLQAFNQIDDNITFLKLQDNIDLFCGARDNINNINAILNNMGECSSQMSQMRDLPASIDQNLVNYILPHTTL